MTSSAPNVALLFESTLVGGAEILEGVGDYLRENHPWSVYAQPHDFSKRLPKWWESWQGDGVIAHVNSKAVYRAVKAKGVPVVNVMGDPFEDSNMPYVGPDYAAVSAMAAEHLFERGFREFGFFGVSKEAWSVELQDAFDKVLAERGGRADSLLLSRRTLEQTAWQQLVERFARWIEKLSAPVGILLCGDLSGPMVEEACGLAGRVVGQDVGLIGLGNNRVRCELCRPPLSSVDPDLRAVGMQAAALLDRLMKGKRAASSVIRVPPVRVSVRESTDFLAISDSAMAKALHYIQQNFQEKIRIEDVSRVAGLSVSVLQRRFRSELNQTVLGEITSVRIRSAIDLLRDTELSIEEIAERCGFAYAQSMGRVFRKSLGRSPSHYRRRY